MIRRLVSALSGCWLGNILVILPLGDLLYSRRNKLYKKVKGMWPQRLIEVEKLLRSSQENQNETWVCDISISLGMRRCKNLGSKIFT